MTDVNDIRAVVAHWSRDKLAEAILNALEEGGKDLDQLTIDDLSAMDQFHAGGKGATVRLADLANLSPDIQVLDVGGGIGGPARTLAVEFGCRVTSLDLTESYVQAASVLTARLGLDHRVTHQVGNALHIPFADGDFDVVWTQNSGMNIADKERLYAEFHRVLKPGGRLALQEPMAGPVQPVIFPVMWSHDATTHFLRLPAAMRELIETTGFRTEVWDDVTAELSTSGAPSPPYSIQRLVMGHALDAISAAGKRNIDEKRYVMVQAVLRRL